MNLRKFLAVGIFILLDHYCLHAMEGTNNYDQTATEELKHYLNSLKILYDTTKTKTDPEELSMTIKSRVFAGADPNIATDYGSSGTSAMHFAAESGDTDLIKFLLAYKVDFEINDAKKNTPLMWAARCGNTEAVELFIRLGANIEAQNHFGETALIWAASNKHTTTVIKLISLGANCEAQNIHGMTPLLRATENNDHKTVDKLIELGANIEGTIKAGSPLRMAAALGHSNLVVRFYNAGADIEAKHGNFGALHWAAKEGHKETVVTLVGLGAGDVEGAFGVVIDGETKNILSSWVSGKSLSSSSKHWFYELIRLQQNRALSYALAHSSLDEIRLLINHLDEHKQTPLDVAMVARNDEASSILLSYGANPSGGQFNGIVLANRLAGWHKKTDGQPSLGEQMYLAHYLPILKSLLAFQGMPDELITNIIFWLKDIQFGTSAIMPECR